jgi:hypothetical protein
MTKIKTGRLTLQWAACASLLSLLSAPLLAQTYPDRPIKLVQGYWCGWQHRRRLGRESQARWPHPFARYRRTCGRRCSL